MRLPNFIANLGKRTGTEVPSPIAEDIRTLFGGVTTRRELFTVMSIISKRAELATRMGKSFLGKRDIYETLGYAKDLKFGDYKARYDRQDIAKKIVRLPSAAVWRKKPQISEKGSKPGSETEFEKKWDGLVQEKRVWHYLARLDRISGIGRYGMLFLGFDDGDSKPSDPVEGAKDLLYLFPYTEGSVEVKTWVEDTKDERFGMPETYSVTKQIMGKQRTSQTETVHHSRTIHVAEDLEEDEVYGTPRLKHVYNRLQDLELVAGGSGEMFWRGAYPGMAVIADKDLDWGPDLMATLEDEIGKFTHDLQRVMRLKGATIEQLAPAVASPKDHVQVLLELIAGAIDIPVRILIGSERGELASTQDERNWASRVDERRRDHVEPMIIRPFIDRLIDVGILPKTKEGYDLEWPDIYSPSEKDLAETAQIKSKAIANYVSAIGADMIVPPEIFLKSIMGFNREEMQEIDDILGKMEEGGEGE